MKSGLRKKSSEKNTLADVMKQISGKSGLSEIYANQCVHAWLVTHLYQQGVDAQQICDALRDLVPFVQFTKREKHPWRSVNFSKVAGWKPIYAANAPLRNIKMNQLSLITSAQYLINRREMLRESYQVYLYLLQQKQRN